ncbi:MAG: iron-containing alcohol dehydrogenase [Clostridiales bacterium]|jgi:alcohol dehydrogenase|nr:iron-containing alcohol dehydrogenase [Clostridiales bacterium]
MYFNFHIPTKIIFKNDAVEDISNQKLPGIKALIVTGGTSVKKYGYLDRLTYELKQNRISYVIYDKITPNPFKSAVQEATELAKLEKCDFVIGLGGGSVMDSAKSIALLYKNGGDLWDYVGGGTGKAMPVRNGALPIVTVSTTAATGSEVNPFAVITKEITCEKAGLGNECLYPAISFIDPKLTVSIPGELTAFHGFDILTHAAEAYINKNANPLSDMLALKSIALVAEYLPKAVENGENLEARRNLSYANILSGFVESLSGCTSEHSLEHALSAYHQNLPHGAGLAFLAEDYFNYFLNICPERIKDLSVAAGYYNSAEGFIEFLNALKKKCFIDNVDYKKYGLNKNMILIYTKNAIDVMGNLFKNDRKTLDFKDVMKIYNCCFMQGVLIPKNQTGEQIKFNDIV